MTSASLGPVDRIDVQTVNGAVGIAVLVVGVAAVAVQPVVEVVVAVAGPAVAADPAVATDAAVADPAVAVDAAVAGPAAVAAVAVADLVAGEAAVDVLVVVRSLLLCLRTNYRRMNIDEWTAPCGSLITAMYAPVSSEERSIPGASDTLSITWRVLPVTSIIRMLEPGLAPFTQRVVSAGCG